MQGQQSIANAQGTETPYPGGDLGRLAQPPFAGAPHDLSRAPRGPHPGPRLRGPLATTSVSQEQRAHPVRLPSEDRQVVTEMLSRRDLRPALSESEGATMGSRTSGVSLPGSA